MESIIKDLLLLSKKYDTWFSISEDGLQISLNCNDIVPCTAYGYPLYVTNISEICTDKEIDYDKFKNTIQEGTDYTNKFLFMIKETLGKYYPYNLEELDTFIKIHKDFDANYKPKYNRVEFINHLR